MPSVRNMKKTIVVDSDNLICKNCGVSAAVVWQNFNQQTGSFMASHENCQHGDDVISLNQIAMIIGISEKNFRNYSQKINMPAQLPNQKSFGRKKMFNRAEILHWLEVNDIKKLICSIRANEYRAAKPEAKPYVPKQIRLNAENDKKPKQLSLMSRFIRGEFATSHQQIERRAKIEVARVNKPKTMVLKCEIDSEWRLTRRFL